MRSTSADRVCPLQESVPSLAGLGSSQTLMTARHTCLRNSKSLFESFHFLRRLELALRPKSSFRSLNANPLASQTLGKPQAENPSASRHA